MSLSRILRHQAGDTIVEVMVVLAVLGLAIGISYATANRSLLDARQAQENSQATELLQSQIENLRVLATNVQPSPNYIFIPTQFCISSSNNVASPLALGRPCHYDNLYDITINYTKNAVNPSGLVGGTFKLVATWTDVHDQGNDTVTLTYRYYQQ